MNFLVEVGVGLWVKRERQFSLAVVLAITSLAETEV